MDLTQKKCQVCEGGTQPLGPDLIEDLMKQVDSAWQVMDDKKIQRDFSWLASAHGLPTMGQSKSG